MRPVNLLPGSDRPRAATPVPNNASTAVVVALGLLVLAVAGFVFTKNQVTSRNADIAQATQEKAEAEQRTKGLQPFGDFSQIKETRVQSVTQLAGKRFDWERLMRELALVLPAKVWLTEVTGGKQGEETTAATSADANAAATSAGSARMPLKVTGCAPSQKAVAETMVRLQSLDGAEDVTLQSSTAPSAASGAGAGPTSGSGDSVSSSAGCGSKYQFASTVEFKTPEVDAEPNAKRVTVPKRLGGGS